MTTTPTARILDMVRMTCGGALDGIIRLELMNTLRDFFQRTDSWLLEVPIYIVPNTNDYQVQTGQSSVVVNRLMGLDRPRSPPPAGGSGVSSYLPMCPPQYLSTAGQGGSQEIQDPALRTQRAGVLLNAGARCPILRISQNPSSDEVWIALLALVPTDPTDSEGVAQLPEWIAERYMNYLANGVNSRLMLQPGKPYSSLPGAQYHGRKFNEGVGLCRTEVRRMFTYGSQRWQFPGGWKSGAGLFAYGAS